MKKTFGFEKVTVIAQVVLIALLMIFPAIRAGAEPVQVIIIPSLTLQEELKSNVYNTTDDKVSSLGTRVMPKLGMEIMSADNVTLQVAGSYDRVWYHSRDAKDANHNTWRIGVDSTGAWALSPNFKVTPSVYFITTEDSGSRAGYMPINNPILSPSGIAFSNTRRQSTGTGFDFEYLVSPKWSTNLRVYYMQENFREISSTASTGTAPVDSSQMGVRAGASYAISPLSRAGFFAQASYFSFDKAPNSELYTVGLTYSYQFTQWFMVSMDAGAAHSIRDNATGSDSGDNKTGPMGAIRFEYNRQTFKAVLSGSTGYSGASGYGDIIRDYRAGLTISEQITMTIRGEIAGFYQVSQSVYQKNVADISSLFGSATLTYQPWEIMSFFLRGVAQHQNSKGSFGNSIDSYMAILGITVAVPYKIF